MKRCPHCNTLYSDDALTFCLADGAALKAENFLGVPQKLKGPAVGLISSGAINILWSIVWLLSNTIGFLQPENRNFTTEAEKYGGIFGFLLGQGFLALGLTVGIFGIYAGTRMLRGEKYRLVRIAAILNVIPCTACCFLVGVPVGVWALVVLSEPQVKSFFQSRA